MLFFDKIKQWFKRDSVVDLIPSLKTDSVVDPDISDFPCHFVTVPPKPLTFRCAVCAVQIAGIDRFVCRYCNKEHCAKHRLPEDHGCPNPKNPFNSAVNK